MLILAILAFVFGCLIFILELSFIIFLTSSFIHLFPKNSKIRIFALFSSGILLFFTVNYVLGDLLSILVWNPTDSEKNGITLLSILFSLAASKLNYDYFIKNKVISMKTNLYIGLTGLLTLGFMITLLLLDWINEMFLALFCLECLIFTVFLIIFSYPFIFKIKNKNLKQS